MTSRDWVGRAGRLARPMRPTHPIGLELLPGTRVRVGRASPIGLKPDPTVTLDINAKKLTKRFDELSLALATTNNYIN